MNIDIAGFRFGDKARWRIKGEGGKKVKEGEYRYFNSSKMSYKLGLFSFMSSSCQYFFSFVFWKE
jgi:hypothetical protein